ncbi:hypothetical protein D9619_000241 [Psilocybe cf. subviscida]|uniref:Protein YOP1 n=1 Tax=Psilocybe cf. subviscida TaxID=2480587 RepID=A0A8H5BGC3_9AGAR|nr:hypothetical protein D9619_000241 [Psilocybe cf. subviscida]
MALFVPILRLLLLFLNVYDSFKTLKAPPPSSRNAGRPSVRALSQRKRDMKGCLAVWIVWVALSMYERTMESVICLLVPFYDEFKSIALLFLILTRARGAEPIYLHIIRPMVKPYTSTVDGILEVMLMTGDFFFAMAMYPIQLSIAWWRKKFHTNYEVCDSDQETDSTTSSDQVNTSELPSSFLASLEQSSHPAPLRKTSSDDSVPEYPLKALTKELPSRKSTRERETRSTAIPIRKPTKEDPNRKGSRDTLRRKEQVKADRSQLEPNFFDQPRRRSGSPTRSNTAQSDTSSASTGLEPNFFQSPPRSTVAVPQVWYPPKQAYADEGLDAPDADTTIRPSDKQSLLAREHQQFEEWRQYPAFPSAYPPTPLPNTTKLTVASAAYVAIEEEAPLQDFHPSLAPPREPLNPSPAGDSSDNNPLNPHGNSNLTMEEEEEEEEDDDDDGSMSTDEYEEEDAFNVTLRTPLKPLGSLRSQIMPQRMVPQVSVSSAFSVPSIASALTTTDNNSLSRKNSQMSESSLSDSPISHEPHTTTLPVIGKKRAAPRTRPLHADNRVRQVEDDSGANDTSDDPKPSQLASTLKLKRGGTDRRAPLGSLDSDTGDDAPTSSSNDQARDVQVPPEEKRRKVTRAHPRVGTAPASAAAQIPERHALRSKAKPQASAATRVSAPATSSQTLPRSKFLEVPVPSQKLAPRRPLRPAGSTQRMKENDAVRSMSNSDSAKESTSASASASEMSMPPPPIPLKATQSHS